MKEAMEYDHLAVCECVFDANGDRIAHCHGCNDAMDNLT